MIGKVKLAEVLLGLKARSVSLSEHVQESIQIGDDRFPKAIYFAFFLLNENVPLFVSSSLRVTILSATVSSADRFRRSHEDTRE